MIPVGDTYSLLLSSFDIDSIKKCHLSDKVDLLLDMFKFLDVEFDSLRIELVGDDLKRFVITEKHKGEFER